MILYTGYSDRTLLIEALDAGEWQCRDHCGKRHRRRADVQRAAVDHGRATRSSEDLLAEARSGLTRLRPEA